MLSEAERKDIQHVARLLGQPNDEVDSMLDRAKKQVGMAMMDATSPPPELRGKAVCFTGELAATIHGVPVSRATVAEMAADAGLTVQNGVTKKLDLLVVADSNTQCGKAKQARQHGTRIIAVQVFWQANGAAVD